MRPIDGDALEKDLRESHDQLREIYNGLKYDDDRQICAGQLTTFIEAILRIKDAPTIDQYGTWIPCSERLPEYEGSYMTTTEYGAVRVNHFYTRNKTWGYKSNRTIAWMPLPESYREEKKDE